MIGIILGSKSDLPTMENTKTILERFNVEYELKIISAHRAPELLYQYAKTAEKRGIKVLIAGAGGAAHLPGVLAALTTIPVIGVPIQSKALNGLDSLLSIVQMPKGIPVATVAIGDAGAANAALLAISILSGSDEELKTKLINYRQEMKKGFVDHELSDIY
jgi:5-(carboxyamino)imidazole ribonucleotide mutase